MPTKLWIHFLIHPLEFDQGMKMAIKLYGKTLEEQREPSQTNLKTEKYFKSFLSMMGNDRIGSYTKSNIW